MMRGMDREHFEEARGLAQEELEVDAKRYRWVRENWAHVGEFYLGPEEFDKMVDQEMAVKP